MSRRLCISGDAKYGIPVLDPLYVQEIYVQESGINITARDIVMEGAKDAILEEFR
jgi:hypothetical protein